MQHEGYRAPEPSQMRQLAVAGLTPGSKFGRGFHYDRLYVTRGTLDRLIEDELSEELIGESRRLGVRLGRVATGFGERAWRLMHVESEQKVRLDGEMTNMRATSVFEWSEKDGVYLAQRSLQTSSDAEEYAQTRRSESIEDDLAISMAEHDFRRVTYAECDELIESTRAYYREAVRQ